MTTILQELLSFGACRQSRQRSRRTNAIAAVNPLLCVFPRFPFSAKTSSANGFAVAYRWFFSKESLRRHMSACVTLFTPVNGVCSSLCRLTSILTALIARCAHDINDYTAPHAKLVGQCNCYCFWARFSSILISIIFLLSAGSTAEDGLPAPLPTFSVSERENKSLQFVSTMKSFRPFVLSKIRIFLKTVSRSGLPTEYLQHILLSSI